MSGHAGTGSTAVLELVRDEARRLDPGARAEFAEELGAPFGEVVANPAPATDGPGDEPEGAAYTLGRPVASASAGAAGTSGPGASSGAGTDEDSPWLTALGRGSRASALDVVASVTRAGGKTAPKPKDRPAAKAAAQGAKGKAGTKTTPKGKPPTKKVTKAKPPTKRTPGTPAADPVTALVFRGRTLEVQGMTTLRVPAISGLLPFHPKNVSKKDHTGPQSQDLPDVGPIREGSYTLKAGSVERKGFSTALWGPLRARLQEGTLTSWSRQIWTKRTGGFFLHEDVKRDGTAGCIGLQSRADTLAVFARISATKGDIPLTVEYPKVSVELEKDAPAGDTSDDRVLGWVRNHRALIVAAERRWGVDRRAIAGAIAWEAMKNPRSTFGGGFSRFSGPGKVHYAEHWVGEGDPVAKQVEDSGALPKQTMADRRTLLESPSGAIDYIGAIMRAFADEAGVAGYDITRDPAMLATFYNAWDLPKARAHFATHKPPHALTPGPDMGSWVAKNLPLLESLVGAPAPTRPPAKAGATGSGKGRTP